MTTENTLETMLDSAAPAEATPAPAAPEQQPTGEREAPPASRTSSEQDATVPRRALEDERRKRQQLEQSMQEMRAQLAPYLQRLQQAQQEPEEPADWYTNPEVAAQQWGRSIEQQVAQRVRAELEYENANRNANRSEKAAKAKYGEETVEEAKQLVVQAGLAQQFFYADDPYEDVVGYVRKIKALQEMGDDPASYRERLRAELMAELQGGGGQPQPQTQRRSPVPKSLATVTSSSPRDERGRFTGSRSLSELLD